jgi:hypothetical protein
MWMSRYLLTRVAELYNVEVSFDPKPIPGDWNGAYAQSSQIDRCVSFDPKPIPGDRNGASPLLVHALRSLGSRSDARQTG